MKIKEFTFVHVMIAALLIGGVYLIVEASFTKEPVSMPAAIVEEATKESTDSLKKEQLMNLITPTDDKVTDDVEDTAKVFEILASENKFYPQEISVATGDLVRIIFLNNDGMHNLTIDEIGIKTSALFEGESLEFSFKAAYPGTYKYYCSGDVCTEGEVFGTLIIQ